MRLILFVEGDTERRALPGFLKRWLDSRLGEPIGIDVVRFVGCSQYRKDCVKKANLHLDGPRARDTFAIVGLLDLYALDMQYPPRVTTVQDKYQWAKEQIEREVNRTQFSQHFAVHEVEAWLLSDPVGFPSPVQRELERYRNAPESVDFAEPPSKLLNRIYITRLRRRYRKVVDGCNLFGRLDPTTPYEACPFFRRMLDDIVSLARSEGLGRANSATRAP